MTNGRLSRLSRLPLRVRLVAGFSAATLLALIAAGAFVYWRVEYALDRGLDTELVQSSASLDPLVGDDGAVANHAVADATDVVWQVVDQDGHVLDHGGPAKSTRLVSARRLAHLRGASAIYNKGDLLPISPKPYRVRISRLTAFRGYLLVAVRRDHRDEALRELLVQLTVAGLGMLAFSAFVGDRLARASLRPVERFRQQAAAIADGAADLRLEVPAGRDDEVTRLGHTFNEMLGSLERALDRERAFVNEASHELRTPITLLTSRIQLARRRKRSSEEYEKVLAELDVDLGRLAGLAEHLLQVGATVRSPQASGDITAVAQRMSEGRDTSGSVVMDVPRQPIRVTLADVDIERILTNLIDNASVHGASPITVAIDTPSDGWARISVSDRGAGMPADFLGSATRRFARADVARSKPGAGLGLSIVESLAVQAGGTLRLCHGDHHVNHGPDVPVGCEHAETMTVTVLLPRST
jgi:two-component system OmpR family sensor kinase